MGTKESYTTQLAPDGTEHGDGFASYLVSVKQDSGRYCTTTVRNTL